MASPWRGVPSACTAAQAASGVRRGGGHALFCPAPLDLAADSTEEVCCSLGLYRKHGRNATHVIPPTADRRQVPHPAARVVDECYQNTSASPACCFNSCGHHGACDRSVCRCAPRWKGIDCLEAEATPARPEMEEGGEGLKFVYVFSPPNRWGFQQLRQRQTLMNSYDTEYHLLRRLLSDWRVRTLNPSQAALFYVPTWAVHLWGNVAFPAHDVWTLGRLGVWLDSQETFHQLLAKFNSSLARRFLFFYGGDKGACHVAREVGASRPTFLTHFGLQVPVEFMGKPHLFRPTAGCTRKACALKSMSSVCHAPRDVVMPFYAAWGHDQEWPHAAGRQAEGSKWACELFFAGRYKSANPMYSQGVRQAVFSVHNRTPGFCLRTKAPAEYWRKSRFCLCPSGGGFGDRLQQSLRLGCVPLIMQPYVTQPLEDVVPYSEFSLRVDLADLHVLPRILASVSNDQHARLRRGVMKYRAAFNWHDGYGKAYESSIYALCLRAELSLGRCNHFRPVFRLS
ncbi:hypothetical protein AB1Y20_021070 [Prymnesium parvum]|uniref:Exostosin GT47 domain-containing protein n=1 Tax=Prymnesium parvum TaxID=97485 RepID=A0AB34JIK7_PRYPA